ncbi:hypothetical protein SAMN05421803_103228 [Nocardiopsis flavescens]|uniref:Uncharacterized protein n=1 Tax=Nocardiopsis flavescens TaxID=758803 RepID=A0A1M6G104_9ACTN|nr:hypothetical protein SAMN05421803_103228 [Nocardiopsis flavescens]
MDPAPAQSAHGRPQGQRVRCTSTVVGVSSGAGSSEAIPAQPLGAGGMPPEKGGGRDKRPERRAHPCPPNAIGGETCAVLGPRAQPVGVDRHPGSRGSTRAYSAPRTPGGEGRGYLPGSATGGRPPAWSPQPQSEGVALPQVARDKAARTCPAVPLGGVHPPGAPSHSRRVSRGPGPQGVRAAGACSPGRAGAGAGAARARGPRCVVVREGAWVRVTTSVAGVPSEVGSNRALPVGPFLPLQVVGRGRPRPDPPPESAPPPPGTCAPRTRPAVCRPSCRGGGSGSAGLYLSKR